METLQKLSRACYNPALGLLIIRVVAGAIFFLHGWMKFGNEAATLQFIQSIGLPGFMAYVVTWVEILGGAMLIFGILTRVAGVALAIVMVVAITKVTYPHGGLNGSQFEFMLLAVSLGLALIGAGKYRAMNMFEQGN